MLSPEHRERAGEEPAGFVAVGFKHGEIRTHCRKHDVKDVWLGQQGGRDAIELLQLLQECLRRQVVDGRIWIRMMWGDIPRDEQVLKYDAISLQSAREFERDQRPEAVAEENRRPIEQGSQDLLENSCQLAQFRDVRLPQPWAAARKQDRSEFHLRRQCCPPRVKRGGAGPSIGKTK